MGTDNKAVARFDLWGFDGFMEPQEQGEYILFTDHERVVGELKEYIRQGAVAALELDAQNRKELTASRAEVERLRKDAERLNFIERTFSAVTTQERYLPLQMIWGKGANGRTLRQAADKYMAQSAAQGE